MAEFGACAATGAEEWTGILIAAVDADNARSDLTCRDARALRALRQVPSSSELVGGAQLAIEDFTAAPTDPLTALRSDAVAHRLTIAANGTPNLAVARMTVPGGPWPGHFGLEAAVFTACPAVLPVFFPSSDIPDPGVLYFGSLVAASRGYREGSGAVLFPEQIAVRTRPARQRFGVVFLGKLAALFRARVLPLLDDADLSAASPRQLTDVRRVAFLAHEWGHMQGPAMEQAPGGRRRRLAAVVAELRADLAALAMLAESAEPVAAPAARALVADRIVREAWLRRAHAQVDAIAARQLYGVLAGCGAVRLADRRLRIDLDLAAGRIAVELARVDAVEGDCLAAGTLEPVREYLRRRGWGLDGQGCHRELEDRVGRFLGYAAAGQVAA